MKKQCQRCKGSGMLKCGLPNKSLGFVDSIIGCPDCFSNGFRDTDAELGRIYCSYDLHNESPYGPNKFQEEE